MDPKSGFLIGLLAMARQEGMWKNVGVTLIGLLLGADLAVLGYIARHVELLEEKVVGIALKQAEAIAERKTSTRALEERLRLLEVRK